VSAVRWPPDARHRVTVRATQLQLIRWGQTAQNHQATTAQLVAMGADFYCILLRAFHEFHLPEEAQEEPRSG
jgi:hypothetical protein